MKKALVVASVISFIEWFNRDNIEYLESELHCEVHVACNLDYMDDTDPVRTIEYIEQMKNRGVVFHNITFERSPLSGKNVKAYNELKNIIVSEHFDLIHCHTPTASILTRLAAKGARKQGTKIIYTAHGYHFFKGAPKKNWLLFYPIEKFCSRFTDVLITITKEDYALSKKKMRAKAVEYVPGVGVDIDKFRHSVNVEEKKSELGISQDDFVVFSIGELNENKNHETIIRAISRIGNPNIRYIIAGKGDKADYLEKLAKELDVRLDLLGFRKDIPDIIGVSDVFAFPSHREGLSKALMEAMAAGLPCVVSNVRGNTDLVDKNGGFLCNSRDMDAFAKGLDELFNNQDICISMGKYNGKKVNAFSKQNVNDKMFGIYKSIVEGYNT